LNQFSKKTIKKLQEISNINDQDELYKNFSSEGICIDKAKYAATAEDETLLSILHYKKDQVIDKFIEFI